jgi:hypothetical protein
MRQGCFGELLVGVVADRVALERVGLELGDRLVDRLHPARHPGMKMACDNIRREPVSWFTLARASAFISLVRNQSRGSSEPSRR